MDSKRDQTPGHPLTAREGPSTALSTGAALPTPHPLPLTLASSLGQGRMPTPPLYSRIQGWMERVTEHRGSPPRRSLWAMSLARLSGQGDLCPLGASSGLACVAFLSLCFPRPPNSSKLRYAHLCDFAPCSRAWAEERAFEINRIWRFSHRPGAPLEAVEGGGEAWGWDSTKVSDCFLSDNSQPTQF